MSDNFCAMDGMAFKSCLFLIFVHTFIKTKLLALASSAQSTDFRKINSFTFSQTGINEQ